MSTSRSWSGKRGRSEGRSSLVSNPVQHEPHSASASLRLRSGPGVQPRRAWGERSRSPHTPRQERVSLIVCPRRGWGAFAPMGESRANGASVFVTWFKAFPDSSSANAALREPMAVRAVVRAKRVGESLSSCERVPHGIASCWRPASTGHVAPDWLSFVCRI